MLRMAPKRQTAEPWWRMYFLRRMDQAAVGGVVFVCLIALAIHFTIQGGLRGRLVEIENAPRGELRFIVDVNKAEWPELAELPDIGETLAKRIVQSRIDEGPFPDNESLRRVRGIGPKTLDRLLPYLRPMPPVSNVAGDAPKAPGA